jgi:tRNA A-37 threonylcarbamoyl transferase component Bud32
MHDDPDAPTIPSTSEPADADGSFGDDGTPESRYARTGRLGAGAMGEVHLCTDRRIGRDVALKVARSPGMKDAALRARFVHEARVQAQLEHPSIVPVYDVGLDEAGAPYFTMKRIQGTTLKRVIRGLASGDADAIAQYTRRRLLTAFASVCLTVHYAHGRGVLHRDLKPANIMLGDYGELYVLDWGVARVAHIDGPATIPPRLASSPDLTEAGEVVGTPGYIAPEQLRGEAYDERSDVYALGAILFEILALEPLHPASDAVTLVTAGVEPVDARPGGRARSLAIPPELDAICAKAASFDPRDRFQSARALHDAVDRYLEGDRDLERRRAASAEHARAAADIAKSALLAIDASTETKERARAMREVSRALALDQDNVDARRVLLELLTQPPRRVPPEVADELARHHWAQNQRAARGGALFYGGSFVLAPFTLPLLGIHVTWYIFLYAALFGLAAASMVHVALAPYRGQKTRYAPVVLTMLALSSLSGLDGPLILVPMVIIANEVGLLMQPHRKRRIAVIASACAAILLPLALEWARVVPPSYAIEHGRTIVMNRVLDFTPMSHAFLIVFTVGFVVAIGLYFIGFRDVLTNAEQRLFLFTWQLRQLVDAPREREARRLSEASRAESSVA